MNFFKYEGAGNDFIMIDNRNESFEAGNNDLVAEMCSRKTGIGADGLLLLENHSDYDFKMRYYNADGSETEMCGNGARCIVLFANFLGIIGGKTNFMAGDGSHEAYIEGSHVRLKIRDIDKIQEEENFYLINTGVPHYVCFTEDLNNIDVYKEGRKIRYSQEFNKIGINVNFVSIDENKISVRTYERGVENETLACGTGIVASSIITSIHTGRKYNNFTVLAKGGILEVSFDPKENNIFKNIWLKGPARFVYKGEYK